MPQRYLSMWARSTTPWLTDTHSLSPTFIPRIREVAINSWWPLICLKIQADISRWKKKTSVQEEFVCKFDNSSWPLVFNSSWLPKQTGLIFNSPYGQETAQQNAWELVALVWLSSCQGNSSHFVHACSAANCPQKARSFDCGFLLTAYILRTNREKWPKDVWNDVLLVQTTPCCTKTPALLHKELHLEMSIEFSSVIAIEWLMSIAANTSSSPHLCIIWENLGDNTLVSLHCENLPWLPCHL